MFPNNQFASQKVYTNLLPPRTLHKQPLKSATRLHSSGRVVQAEYDWKTGSLWIDVGTENAYLLWIQPDIKWFEFTYDQLDRVFVAYQVGDWPNSEVWIYWFDPVPSAYVFTKIAEGMIRPVCCMDDRRFNQSASNDILLAYQKRVVEFDPLGNEILVSNEGFWLTQRERYLQAHPMPYVPEEAMLTTCGMTREWRFAFTWIAELPDTVIVYAGARQVGAGDGVAVAL